MKDIIVTRRLTLQPVQQEDGDFLTEMVNHDECATAVRNLAHRWKTDSINCMHQLLVDPHHHFWIVKLKSSGESIGYISLHRRSYSEHFELAFVFLEKHKGKGYVFEATRNLMGHVVGEFGITHVTGKVKEDDADTNRLFRYLGLKQKMEIYVGRERYILYEAQSDELSIAALAGGFFSVFANKDDIEPELNLLKELCIPEVLITNKYGSTVDVFDLDTFINSRQKILTGGMLTEFTEHETEEETKIADGIAIRFSRYEKSGIVYKQRFKMKGHKIFQFVKVQRKWKIASVLWEDGEQ